MPEHPYENALERGFTAWEVAMVDDLEATYESPFDAEMVQLAARRVPYTQAADQAAEEGFWVTAWIIRRLVHATPRRSPRPRWPSGWRARR